MSFHHWTVWLSEKSHIPKSTDFFTKKWGFVYEVYGNVEGQGDQTIVQWSTNRFFSLKETALKVYIRGQLAHWPNQITTWVLIKRFATTTSIYVSLMKFSIPLRTDVITVSWFHQTRLCLWFQIVCALFILSSKMGLFLQKRNISWRGLVTSRDKIIWPATQDKGPWWA